MYEVIHFGFLLFPIDLTFYFLEESSLLVFGIHSKECLSFRAQSTLILFNGDSCLLIPESAPGLFIEVFLFQESFEGVTELTAEGVGVWLKVSDGTRDWEMLHWVDEKVVNKLWEWFWGWDKWEICPLI